MQELYDTFVAILTETFAIPGETITRDTTFYSLDLDSLDLVELTLLIEERTGIRIEDKQLASIETVGNAVDAAAAQAGAVA
jgi:acyl carrier protein